MSALQVLPGGAEGGPRRGSASSSRSTWSRRSSGARAPIAGDVAGFIGRALPLVTDLAPAMPASASALRRARLHALAGGGEVTDGRAVLRVAG